MPVARIRLGRRGGRLSGSVQVGVPLLNVAVGLFSYALTVLMAAYWLDEKM